MQQKNRPTVTFNPNFKVVEFDHPCYLRRFLQPPIKISPENLEVSDIIPIFAHKYLKKVMSTEMMSNAIANYFKTQPVLKAWLFGSFARGEETPISDVDILVVLDNSKPIGFKFFGMWNDLEELLDRSVDLVTEGSLADFARESVERDKILIYERAA